jgi:Sigma-70 region 2
MASATQDEVLIDTCSSDNEISLKLLAAAPDEVLAAAKLGDRAAFGELWQRHSNTAFNIAYRITRNTADAEDVVQEAWMKAYAHLKTFDGRASLRVGSCAFLPLSSSEKGGLLVLEQGTLLQP